MTVFSVTDLLRAIAGLVDVVTVVLPGGVPHGIGPWQANFEALAPFG